MNVKSLDLIKARQDFTCRRRPQHRQPGDVLHRDIHRKRTSSHALPFRVHVSVSRAPLTNGFESLRHCKIQRRPNGRPILFRHLPNLDRTLFGARTGPVGCCCPEFRRNSVSTQAFASTADAKGGLRTTARGEPVGYPEPSRAEPPDGLLSGNREENQRDQANRFSSPS